MVIHMHTAVLDYLWYSVVLDADHHEDQLLLHQYIARNSQSTVALTCV